MSIIEKLGITPGPWEATGAYKQLVCKGDMIIADCSTNNVTKRFIPENTNLIATAPELLEVLIDVMESIIGVDEEGIVIYTEDMDMCKIQSVIEKACYPKKWEEIKKIADKER